MDPTPIEDEDGVSPLDWLPLLLQTSDALFPTGSYAHSLGFEECVRLGLARDEHTLREFLSKHLLPSLASFELPYLRLARQAVLAEEWDVLASLDEEMGASKLARETREASIQLGVRRLKSLRTILPEDPRLARCEQAVQAKRMCGHHVVVCGVQAVALGLPLETALGVYGYQSLAATGSAALKLMRIGQDGVQRALRSAGAKVPQAVARSLTVAREDAGWFDPLLEIASMRHERAGERLFIS